MDRRRHICTVASFSAGCILCAANKVRDIGKTMSYVGKITSDII